MAEGERKSSGCGFVVLCDNLLRRKNTGATRRSTISSVGNATVNSKRCRSNETGLVTSTPTVKPQKVQQNRLPVVHTKTHANGYQKANAGMGQAKVVEPGMGLSEELESMMYDRQLAKGNDTLVRASSSNVMLFGDLGNLRARKGNCPNMSVLDFLPPTEKEVANASRQANRRDAREDSRQPTPPSTVLAPTMKRMEPEELKEMGNEEYKKGRYVEALVHYNGAIAMDPKKASYWNNKTAALMALGRFLDAVIVCREAVNIDPSYKIAHHQLAGLYLRLGEAKKAVYHYKLAGKEATAKHMAQAQNIQAHMNKCNEARRLKNWHTMLKEAEAAISSGADSAPQVFAAQADALLKLQRHREAELILIDSPTFEIDESTKFFGATSNAYILTVRAQIDMSAGRFDEAVSRAQMAVRVDPSSKEAAAMMQRTRIVALSRSRGNVLFKASRFSEASLAYGKGLDHDSHNSILFCNRAACKMKLGQWEKAVDDCTKALDVRPSYSKARLRRADCYAMLEKWESAMRDYEALMEDMPGDQEVQKALAKVHFQLKKERGEDVDDAPKIEDDVSIITTDDQFTHIIESIGASVILFYDKSTEDNQMLPFMVQLCHRYPSVKFAKVDMEESVDLVETDEVSIIPSFRIYKNGSKFRDIDGSDWDGLERCIQSFKG